MRRAVGTEEETRAAAGRGFDQGLTVLLPFQNRQAIVVGPDTTGKNCVAVVKQMVRCDGRRGKGICALDVLCRLLGGDVLKHNLEPGKIPAQRNQVPINEYRLAVK